MLMKIILVTVTWAFKTIKAKGRAKETSVEFVGNVAGLSQGLRVGQFGARPGGLYRKCVQSLSYDCADIIGIG